MLQHVVAENDIEAPVAEGHLLNRALYESHLGITSQSLVKLYVDGCDPASDRAKLVDLDRIATPHEQHVHVRQAQFAPRDFLNEESTSRVLSNAACHLNVHHVTSSGLLAQGGCPLCIGSPSGWP